MNIWISARHVDYEGSFDVTYHKTELGANKAREKLIEKEKEKENIRDCFSKPFEPGERDEYKEMMAHRNWDNFEVYSVEVLD